MSVDLKACGITVKTIHRNLSVARLYELGIAEGSTIADNGALISLSGEKTGRSPKDKRIVEEETTKENVWWGNVNIPIAESGFKIAKDTAVNFLNTRPYLYVVDGFAAWDPKHKIKVRIICSRAYHALFMHNMLMRPTPEELKNFGEPDWVIYNGGCTKLSKNIPGVSSPTSVQLNFKSREFVITGTEYAGEMKKGVFTILNYILPMKGVMSMHCSANEGKAGDTALFFGLSGTGKTTLSADPKRRLIGDDEHGWSEDGIFNFEGGCYAKCINLSAEKEPEIYGAIRFGSVLENVVYNPDTRAVDWTDASLTENTRVSYPVEFINNAKIPCVGGHPKNVVFLTCDAYGVLPPVSRLTPGQAMYHFISGYTAKVAGTEQGVTEPTATFSACFGAAFLVLHPTRYAELLKAQIAKHGSRVWLVNTGWTGGAYGTGKRIDLKSTRAIIDAILDGTLDKAEYETEEVFGLQIPKAIPGVNPAILKPANAWADKAAFEATISKLADLFSHNFEQYADKASEEILEGGPRAVAK